MGNWQTCLFNSRKSALAVSKMESIDAFTSSMLDGGDEMAMVSV